MLFLGEMLTATAMGHFEGEIAQGGRAGAVRSADHLERRKLRVAGDVAADSGAGARRNPLARLASSARPRNALGAVAGSDSGVIGVLRICLWQGLHWYDYGPHWLLVAETVGLSLVGIVLWGSVSGAMLPFILKRLGLDPATSSAPFVATLVDVTGLIIYFGVAQVVLRGTLLYAHLVTDVLRNLVTRLAVDKHPVAGLSLEDAR